MIEVVQLLAPNGMVYQTTLGTQDARNLLEKLKIKSLPEVFGDYVHNIRYENELGHFFSSSRIKYRLKLPNLVLRVGQFLSVGWVNF